MSPPVRRNAPCPCGSGKKYKQCCLRKGFALEQGADGNVDRVVPLPDAIAEELGEYTTGLEEKLGRPITGDDQLFADRQLEHVEHDLTQAMQAANIDPSIIYAFEKTGLLVSEENQHLISDVDMQAWQAAVEEYRTKHPDP